MIPSAKVLAHLEIQGMVMPEGGYVIDEAEIIAEIAQVSLSPSYRHASPAHLRDVAEEFLIWKHYGLPAAVQQRGVDLQIAKQTQAVHLGLRKALQVTLPEIKKQAAEQHESNSRQLLEQHGELMVGLGRHQDKTTEAIDKMAEAVTRGAEALIRELMRQEQEEAVNRALLAGHWENNWQRFTRWALGFAVGIVLLLIGLIVLAATAHAQGSPVIVNQIKLGGTPIGADSGTNAIKVYLTNGGSGGTSSTFGAAFPATGTAAGFYLSGNMTYAAVDSSHNMLVAWSSAQHAIIDSGTLTISNTTFAATQGTSPWVISFTAPQHVIVDSSASVAVTGPLTDAQLRATPVPISGTVTVTDGSGALNVIVDSGHSIIDSGSTTAVTQATGTNLHAVIDSGSTTAVTQATGTNLHAVIDSGSTTAVTQATASNLNATVVGTGTFATQAAATIADGADVTLGAKADAKSTATDTTAITLMQVAKQISASVQAPPSQAVTNTGTFAVQAAATLAAETTKVIGTVNQGTSPWIVAGGGTAGSAATGVVTIQGIASGTVVPVSGTITAVTSITNQVDTNLKQVGGTNTVTGGTAGSVGVGGTTATNVAITDNPVNLGAQAVSSENSAATTARKVQLVADLVGKLITLPYANPENFVMGTTAAITDTTSTSTIASAGGSLRNYLTSCTVTNSHATVGTFVKILDGSTIIWEAYAAAAGGGASASFPTPLKGTAATAINCQPVTTGANVICSCSGYKGL